MLDDLAWVKRVQIPSMKSSLSYSSVASRMDVKKVRAVAEGKSTYKTDGVAFACAVKDAAVMEKSWETDDNDGSVATMGQRAVVSARP